jgi:hypothetical protein
MPLPSRGPSLDAAPATEPPVAAARSVVPTYLDIGISPPHAGQPLYTLLSVLQV